MCISPALTPDASFWLVRARPRVVPDGGAAVPVPDDHNAIPTSGCRRRRSGQASALINVARNLGGSIGVSLAQTLLARREQFHQSRLVEHVSSSATAYQHTVRNAAAYFAAHGAGAVDAQRKAIAWIGQEVAAQAAYLSYIDVFAALSIVSFVLIPVAFLIKGDAGASGGEAGAAGGG